LPATLLNAALDPPLASAGRALWLLIGVVIGVTVALCVVVLIGALRRGRRLRRNARPPDCGVQRIDPWAEAGRRAEPINPDKPPADGP